MPNPGLSYDDAYRTCVVVAQHGPGTASSRELGLGESTVRSRLRAAKARYGLTPESVSDSLPEDKQKPLESTEFEEDHANNRASLRIITTDQGIDTPEKAMRHAEIDPDQWECVKFKVTAHQMGSTDKDKNPQITQLVNVSVELKPRRPDDPVRVKEEIREWIASHKPKIRKPSWSRRPPKPEIMLEISVPDIHIGKLSDREETGNDYNIAIARNLYRKAHEHILAEASRCYEIGSILTVLGSDILHTEAGGRGTTKGTPQDTDGVWRRAYREAREAMCEGVMLCREVAPVTGLAVPDNHAKWAVFCAADATWCYFRGDPHVEIDATMATYKYHRHNRVLIGVAHGDQAKGAGLAARMVRDRQDFHECVVHEWHTGHWHKELVEDTEYGIKHRRDPSLSGTDLWHAEKCYAGDKSAIGRVWGPQSLLGTVRFTPTEDDYKA